MNKQAQNEEFYKLYKWMVTDLHLSGNDLVVYAIIYSFCERGNLYVGSREFLAHEAGATKRTIDYTLKRLLEMGMIEKVEFGFKCVKQPLTMCAKIAQKSAKIACAKIAQKSANFTSDCAKIAHNKIIDKKINIECSDSVIDSEPTHTLTHTENFLFDFFKSKIQSATDESCVRNLAKKFANIEQAKLFAEFCEERKTNLHLGMITKLFNEIFDRACEWDAQGRPRKHAKQPEQPPQPTPQMLPQQRIPENSAKEAEIYDFNVWRGQVIDCIKKKPKFAKKTLMQMMRITTQVTDKFPTPCDIEIINQYLNEL
jgi:hypothetical protein